MSRERMLKTFTNLVGIDSVSKDEGALHQFLKEKLTALGMLVTEDQSRVKTGLGSDNLLAVHDGGKNRQALFFSCHTDTVTPGQGICMTRKKWEALFKR